MALTDNLQAFYKLSDTSDSSGNNRTLTNNGNVSFASGKLGNAAVGDGSSYLTIPSLNLQDYASYSVGFWFVKPNQSGAKLIFSAGTGGTNGNIGVYTGPSHGAGLQVYTPDWEGSDIAINDNEWVHLVITQNETEIKLFVNNVLQYIRASSPLTGSTVNFLSGEGGTYACDGQIDAVGIWNRAVSDAEVAALYNNGTGLELDPPNYQGEWDNFTYYGQDDVVSVSGVYWKLTGLGGWTVGGAPGLGYGWTLLVQAPVGGKISLSGRISLLGRVKFAV